MLLRLLRLLGLLSVVQVFRLSEVVDVQLLSLSCSFLNLLILFSIGEVLAEAYPLPFFTGSLTKTFGLLNSENFATNFR